MHGYVAAEYSGSWWVAYVAQFTPYSNEVLVHFLHPNGPSPTYIFPELQDALSIDATDVLVPLSPMTVSGGTYSLSVEENNAAATALTTKKCVKQLHWNNQYCMA